MVIGRKHSVFDKKLIFLRPGRQFSVGLLCFCISYKRGINCPFQGTVFSKMYVQPIALEDTNSISLWSKGQVYLQLGSFLWYNPLCAGILWTPMDTPQGLGDEINWCKHVNAHDAPLWCEKWCPLFCPRNLVSVFWQYPQSHSRLVVSLQVG